MLPLVVAKSFQQQPRRRGEGPAHRGVVDLAADGQLAAHQQPARFAGREGIVAHEVVEPEDDVVGRERRAVGPLHAGAQIHGDGATVFGEFPVAEHIRNDHIGRAVPACREVVGGVAVDSQLALRRDAEGPAASVLAHLLDGLNHHRLRGKPFLERGKRPLLNHRGERRRFVVLHLCPEARCRQEQTEQYRDARYAFQVRHGIPPPVREGAVTAGPPPALVICLQAQLSSERCHARRMASMRSNTRAGGRRTDRSRARWTA